MTQPDSLDVLGEPVREWGLRWSALTRALAIVAVLLTGCAVIFGVLAAHTVPQPITVSVRAPVPPPAATIDAVGCPQGRSCTVYGSALPALQQAFARHFPAGSVLRGEQTADKVTGRIYRATLSARAPAATTVTISTQCVPQGLAPAEEITGHVDEHADLNDNIVTTAREFTALIPGAAGCSAWLLVHSIGAAHLDMHANLALAHDPKLQLKP
jgi:hypothetical protein